ncbi:MAG: hypothetical protein PUB07_06820 [Clostridia bacterium]|nr:hypothetical protein [Clostridia bacterium]
MPKKKIADKKEVQRFLTTVLRNEEADVKDRLKVSEYLLKMAGENEATANTLSVEVKVVE